MTDNVLDLQARSPRFRLLRAGTLKPRPMDWLVRGLFESNSLVLIFGDPSGGKSFLTLDISASIATGIPFHDCEVKQGPVVYIAGEGHNGIARRLAAWQIQRECDLTDAPLYVSEMPASIGDSVNTGVVLEAIEDTGEKPALIVLDTLNRNMAGDENSTNDMHAFIAACDEIRTTYRCAVALVHHTGHAEKNRPRGSSVLHGAIDSTFQVQKDPADIVTVTNTRQKDAPMCDPFAFRLASVELGFRNDDGIDAASAVLEPCGVPQTKPKASGKWQRAALEELKRLYQDHCDRRQASGLGSAAARVRRDDWRASCLDIAGMKANRFAEVEASLIDKGLVIQRGYYVTPV